MSIVLAYIGVVLTWSTTPLAIQWSIDGMHFVMAISLRMAIAGACGFLLLKMAGVRLIQNRSDVFNFAVGSLSFFPSMVLAYWAATQLPSGLMSVIFGCFPFWVGIFSHWMLKDNRLNLVKVSALILAFCGLVIVNIDQLAIGFSSALAVLVMVLATSIWALSAVLIKRLPVMQPFRQGVGASLMSAPFFIMTIIGITLLGNAESVAQFWALEASHKSIAGITYLVIVASLVGHTLFFYVLQRCSVVLVAFIPLLAPILALILGWLVEGESLSQRSFYGVLLVLLAICLYQGRPIWQGLSKLWHQLQAAYRAC